MHQQNCKISDFKEEVHFKQTTSLFYIKIINTTVEKNISILKSILWKNQKEKKKINISVDKTVLELLVKWCQILFSQ